MMSIHSGLLFVTAGACLGLALKDDQIGAPGQTPDQLETRVAGFAEKLLKTGDASGVSVAVAIGPEVYISGGWGEAVHDREQTASAESEYRIGSLTDQFTSVVVMQLVENEELDLDASISEYLPELEFPEEKVTIRHLLTHTSGVPSYSDLYGPEEWSDACFEGEELLKAILKLGLDSSPGKCFEYSNTNTYLLGLIVERSLEQGLADVLTQRLFQPLEMEDTQYCSIRAPLEELSDAGREVVGDVVTEFGIPQPFGAEGLCSTALDLVRWQRAFVEGELVAESTLRSILEPARLSDGTATSFGLGFNLMALDERECFSYGGGMSGCRVHVAYYPAEDMSIVVLANGASAPADRLERRIARFILGIPEPGLKDLSLEENEAAQYMGSYYIGCSRYIVAKGEKRLLVQPPSSDQYTLLYQGDHVFVADFDTEVRLLFQVDDGRVNSFILEEHGAQSVAVRFE